MAAMLLVAQAGFAQSVAPPEVPAPVRFRIEVSEDSRCANDPRFIAQLTQQIPEEQRGSFADAELVVIVRVEKLERSLRASVSVRDLVLQSEAGSRALELAPNSSCQSIGESLALVVAVLVEAGRGAPAQGADPHDREPEAEPEPEPQPDASSKPASEPARPRYSWLGPKPGHDLDLGVGFISGLLPGLTPAFGLSWGIRAHRVWPIRLGVAGLLPVETRGDLARFEAFLGTIGTCPLRLERGPLHAWLCPELALGLLTAKGQRFLETQSSRQPLVALGAETGARVRLLGPLTLGISVHVTAPIYRPRFIYYRIDGEKPVLHQPKPVSIAPFLTVGLRFR
jgi:hypothetical protein